MQEGGWRVSWLCSTHWEAHLLWASTQCERQTQHDSNLLPLFPLFCSLSTSLLIPVFSSHLQPKADRGKTCRCVWSVFSEGEADVFGGPPPPNSNLSHSDNKRVFTHFSSLGFASPSERGLVVDMLIAEKSNLKECITMSDFFSHVSPKIMFTKGLT